jgi:hypothetical protein
MIQDEQGASRAPDAVALRKADHLEVRALFERYERLVAEGAAGETRRALAQDICVRLTVDITAEEEIFYPAACAAIGEQDVLCEATAMHRRARHLIADIVDMAPADPMLDERVKVLNERVDRHMAEEEGRLFARLRAAGSDLGGLGARMAARKGELMAEMLEVEG